MALTRKMLSAFGIEADKVDEIIEAHTETVNGLKAERDQYKAEAEKLPSIQKELEALKAKQDGDDPYKEKYEALNKEFTEFKAEIEQRDANTKKENAYRAILKDIGISDKRIDAVMKVSDFSGVEFDEQGNIKEADKLKESLKSEWADFISTKRVEGAGTANPPTNDGKTTMTKEQIRAIADPAARQKAMLENAALFGLPDSE